MKITYLGGEVDTSKEHEMLSENDFGFNVKIKYTDDSFYPNKELVLNNCTEVHHLWSLDYMGGPSIAFESNLHQTGFTRRVDVIESVNIELSESLFESYYN